jgi:hypothetical protein
MNDGDNQFPTGPMELPGEPESNYPQHVQQPPKSGVSRKRLVLVVVGLLIIGSVGFAAAILTSDKKEPSTPAPAAEETPTPQSSQIVGDVPVAAGTKTFKGDFPRVEFTYPDNWTVTEDKEQEGIRVESPEFSYTTINGGTVKGNFRVYLRQGARQVDSQYIGRGIAAQQSETLIYTDPAPGQRAETHLSLFGLDTSDNFAFFMIAGNFSLQKDESLGPEYGREQETYIIVGGYSSTELTDDLATNQVGLEYFSQTNAYKQAIEILKSLKIL